jgi:hypothetical protein
LHVSNERRISRFILKELSKLEPLSLVRESKTLFFVQEQSKNIILERDIRLQDSKNLKIKTDEKHTSSPPSTVQREINITPSYLVSPVDMFSDIAVGHKMPT